MCVLQCTEREVCLQPRFSHAVWSGSSRGEGAEEPHPWSTEPESVSSGFWLETVTCFSQRMTQRGQSPTKADPASEVSQQMQIMAVISPGSKDERSVSGVRMKRGNVRGILHPHPPCIYEKQCGSGMPSPLLLLA